MYDRLFAEAAWKDLVEDFKQRSVDLGKYVINSPNITEKELYRAQGLHQIYQYVAGLEASMEAAKKLQAEPEESLPELPGE
jgi:hypothetical protein